MLQNKYPRKLVPLRYFSVTCAVFGLQGVHFTRNSLLQRMTNFKIIEVLANI